MHLYASKKQESGHDHAAGKENSTHSFAAPIMESQFAVVNSLNPDINP